MCGRQAASDLSHLVPTEHVRVGLKVLNAGRGISPLAKSCRHSQFRSSYGPDEPLVVSPDGVHVLVGTKEGPVLVIDIRSRSETVSHEGRMMKGHTAAITAVVFSRDGQKVLTGSNDGSAILWDFSTRQEIGTYQGHQGGVRSLALSPDARKVLTSASDAVILWDVASATKLHVFGGGGGNCAAFSPDGHQVITACGNTAVLWHAATGRKLCVFQGHTKQVNSLAFSPDGRRVLTGSNDGTAILWDATARRQSEKENDAG